MARGNIAGNLITKYGSQFDGAFGFKAAGSAPVAGEAKFDGQVAYFNDLLGYKSSTTGNYEYLRPIQSSGGVITVTENGIFHDLDIALASSSAKGAMSSAQYDLLTGATAAATASTLMLRDGDGSVSVNGLTAAAASVTAAPTSANDVVRLSDLQSAINGLSWKAPVDEKVADHTATTPTGADYRVLNETDGKIYTYDGSAWDTGVAPTSNWSVLVKSDDSAHTYDEATSTWVQFSSAGQVEAGDGMTQTGLVFNIGEGDGISVLSNSVAINANSTFFDFVSGALSIKASSITMNELADLAGAAVTVTGGQFAVDYDNDTIGLVGGQLAVLKNYLETTSVDDATIEFDGVSGQIRVKTIAMGQLDAALAGDGITFASGAIAVDTDGTTTTISGGKVSVVFGTAADYDNAVTGVALDAATIKSKVDTAVSDAIAAYKTATEFTGSFTTIANQATYTISDTFHEAKFVTVVDGATGENYATLHPENITRLDGSTVIDLGANVPAGDVYYVLVKKVDVNF